MEYFSIPLTKTKRGFISHDQTHILVKKYERMILMSKQSALNDTKKYEGTKKEEISSEGLINMFNVIEEKNINLIPLLTH